MLFGEFEDLAGSKYSVGGSDFDPVDLELKLSPLATLGPL